MADSNNIHDRTPGNSEWRRTYWIVLLVGISYVIALGLFTLLFNNPF